MLFACSRTFAATVEELEKAAGQGDSNALAMLGAIFAKGDGVPKNLPKAYAWCILAAAKGNSRVTSTLDALEKQMTVAQKAEALKLSVELLGKLAKK